MTVFIILLLLSSNIFAYDKDDYYLLDPYTISDHNELIELYDNLRSLYERACDNCSSLERDYADLQTQLTEKEGEIKYLEEQLSNSIGSTDDLHYLILVIFIIFVLPYLIYKIVEYLKNKK